jgi:hypothetical protein
VILLGKIVSWLTGGFVDRIFGIAETYIKTEGDKAKFKSEVQAAANEAAANVEKAWAEASSSIAASTQDALKAAPILQRAYAIVLFLQLFVLVWYQLGAPAYEVITAARWPDPMASIEWAYLLIGAMVGAAPFVFKR